MSRQAPWYAAIAGAAALALCGLGAAAAPASAAAPSLSTSFGASTVPLNGSTSLSVVIGNPNNAGLSGVGFSDNLPPGLSVRNPSGASDECGGTVTATAGATSVSLSGGSVPAGSLCAVSVEVTGTTAGAKTNSLTVASSAGSSNQSTASVTVVAPPDGYGSFGSPFGGGTIAKWIALGATMRLSLGLANPNTTTALTGVGYIDTLSPGLVVADPSGLSGTCGGATITAVPGGHTVSLSGATLAPGPTDPNSGCDFSLNVTGTAAGIQTSSAVPASSNEGGSNTTPFTDTLAVFAAGSRVYWGAESGGAWVSFARRDGTLASRLEHSLGLSGTLPVFGVTIDSAAGRIYWLVSGKNKISYANLDDSASAQDLPTAAAIDSPEGLAIDPARGIIYWANYSSGTPGSPGSISYTRLDGHGGGELATTGATVDGPAGVALDPAAGRIYWPNAVANKISYANLDGSGGGHDLPTTGATINSPTGVAIDTTAGRIYWANSAANKISYASLSGSGGGDLATGGATVTDPNGVAIDPAAGRIYWANSSGEISWAGIDGSGGADLGVPGATSGFASFPSLLDPPLPAGAPTVSGATTPGSTLACTHGAWAPDLLGSFLYRVPQRFAYSWSLNGQAIAGATASSYTAAGAGGYRCAVTAANAAGIAVQTSEPHGLASSPAGSSATAGSGSATVRSAAPPTRATISALVETNAIFAVGPSSTPRSGRTAARRHIRGTVFSFRLDQPATVSIAIQARTPGRRVGRACRPDSSGLRRKPSCTRVIAVATLSRTAHAGLNAVAFSGRIGGRALKAGRYQASFTAIDDAGTSAPRSLGFTIARH